jgi:hypothetical protein
MEAHMRKRAYGAFEEKQAPCFKSLQFYVVEKGCHLNARA